MSLRAVGHLLEKVDGNGQGDVVVAREVGDVLGTDLGGDVGPDLPTPRALTGARRTGEHDERALAHGRVECGPRLIHLGQVRVSRDVGVPPLDPLDKLVVRLGLAAVFRKGAVGVAEREVVEELDHGLARLGLTEERHELLAKLVEVHQVRALPAMVAARHVALRGHLHSVEHHLAQLRLAKQRLVVGIDNHLRQHVRADPAVGRESRETADVVSLAELVGAGPRSLADVVEQAHDEGRELDGSGLAGLHRGPKCAETCENSVRDEVLLVEAASEGRPLAVKVNDVGGIDRRVVLLDGPLPEVRKHGLGVGV